MRNGLYGSTSQVRIFWTKVDPDFTVFYDSYRSGSAHHDYVVSLPITEPISQFAVHEIDLTAFLLSQSVKRLILTLHVVPGPSFKERPVRTYDFSGLRSFNFMISSILLLPQETSKILFYGSEFIGEIDLSAYPFTDEAADSPKIKVYRFWTGKDDEVVIGPFDDNSSRAQLMQI